MGRGGKYKREPVPSPEAKKRVRLLAKTSELLDTAEKVASFDDEMFGGHDPEPLKAADPYGLSPSDSGGDTDSENSGEDSDATDEEDDAVICPECVKPLLPTDEPYKRRKIHIVCGRKNRFLHGVIYLDFVVIFVIVKS